MEMTVSDVAFKQKKASLKHAHAQALKILLQNQLPSEFTPNEALAYLDMAKSKLGAEKYEDFMDIMNESKKPNCSPQAIITKVYHLLKYYPELLLGFGMFLPPSMNLMLQTQGRILFRDSCTEDIYVPDIKIEEDSEDENISSVDAKPLLSEKLSENIADTPESSELEMSEGPIKELEVSSKTAFSFLSRVKERFEDEPEIYEKFLELLSSIRDISTSDMDENSNVLKTSCTEILKLFEKHEDLIEDFKVFIPGAEHSDFQDNKEQSASEDIDLHITDDDSVDFSDLMESNYCPTIDPSAAPVYKYGAYEEHLFFDKVRAALEYREVYDNFLRCLMLFNEDIITRSELLKLATSFLGRSPDLLKELKDMLGFSESGENIETVPMRIISYELSRMNPEKALDIDYATGGRNGASYRALSGDHKQPKCSGRTSLCKDVLNDVWVSFPSWSEDSTFVTSRKTQYEEMIYRCEDERFELDIVIQSNLHTIGVLENVQKRINKMTAEEKSMFALDDTLGGTSTVLHQKALHRIYGDKTDELVEGLKRNPVVAVPIILKRLKAKHEEWKEKQKAFNNVWREQIDNYFMKSLDHQGINFKQNDSKSFRSKSLLNEMEMVYAEKKEGLSCSTSLPHFLLELKETTVFLDALNLICQYLKKIPAMYRDDRRRIEHLLRNFIPDFFGYPHANVSEEENEEEEEQAEENMEVENFVEERSGHTSPSENGAGSREEEISDPEESNSVEENENSEESDKGSFIEDSDIFDKMDNLPSTNLPYTQFLVSKSWYIFFRQFHILCERLSRLLHEGNTKDRNLSKTSSEGDATIKVEVTESKPTYVELINKLGQLLSGTIDFPTFEEDVRSLFGIYAFVCFTMDKLVLNIVRQLQQIVNDDLCKQLTGLFMQHMKTISSGGYASAIEASQIEAEYLRKTERLLEDENCFKIMWYKKEHTLIIELIERQNEIIPDPCEVEKFSNYLEAYITEDSICEEYVSFFMGLPVFLPRNLKRQQEYWRRKVLYVENLWKTRYSKSFLKCHPPILSRKRKAAFQLSFALNKITCSENEVNDNIPEDSEVASDVNTQQVEPVEAIVPVEEISIVDSEISKAISAEDEYSNTNDHDEDKEEDNAEEKESVFLISAEENDNEVNGNVDCQILKLECEDVIPEETTVSDTPQEVSLFEETNQSTLTSDVDLEVFKDDIESMDVDYNSCSSTASVEKKESSRDSSYSEKNVSSSREAEKDAVVVPNNPSDDENDDVVEPTVAQVDIITIDSSLEEDVAVVSDSSVEKPLKSEEKECFKKDDSESKSAAKPLKPRLSRKAQDGRARLRRSKIHQDYVRRRAKKNLRTAHSSAQKGKKGKSGPKIPKEYDDISFDFAAFSELSEEDKCFDLAMKSVYVHDDTECLFKKDSYKMLFVQNHDSYLYRNLSLSRAREIHKRVSEIKTSNFNAWHRVWLDRYVTSAMLKSCNDWLLRSETDKYKLIRLTVNKCTKPPYSPYSKYRLRYYKTDA